MTTQSSPFSKPEYKGVMVGGLEPYAMVPLEAVMVRGAGLTVTTPGT